jgi:hypothetical protein
MRRLSRVIQTVYDGPASQADIEETARNLGVSVSALCDEFALEVAKGFMDGDYSWDFGDIAMNGLYSCAYANGDFGLPDFAFEVFEAFDEGEYRHSKGPSGEARTRTLLEPLLARLNS